MPRTGAWRRATSSRASASTTRRDDVAGGAVECDLGAGEDVAVEVEHRAAEDVVSERSTPMMRNAVAVDVEQGGGLARAGVLALAELDHEAVADELGDEVGDRHPGEAGLAGEIGPALRALRGRGSAARATRLWLRACSGSTLLVGRRARERVKIGAPANGTVSRSEAPS